MACKDYEQFKKKTKGKPFREHTIRGVKVKVFYGERKFTDILEEIMEVELQKILNKHGL